MYAQRLENIMKVLVILSGSIAIKKTDELFNLLKKENIKFDCMLTKSALSLIKTYKIKIPNDLKIYTDKKFFNNKDKFPHIELTRKADAIIVYPASANIIGKYANGIADDLASSSLMASNKEVFIAPAMNVEMWNNTANQKNIEKLSNAGVNIIGPAYGNLACGEVGFGRISHAKKIIDELVLHLKTKKTLSGLKGIVTAGPTIEPIDSVRYISNYSSGKQGYAIAKVLASMGAKIKLISGPTNLDKPIGVKLINVKSANEMNEAALDLIPSDFAICTAAVADFKPVNYSFEKKKKEKIQSISLKSNPDILYNISNSKNKRPNLVVGFAAETNKIMFKAKEKLIRKKCDWILANKINKKNNVFGNDKNSIYYITKDYCENWNKISKLKVAKKLNNKIFNYFNR